MQRSRKNSKFSEAFHHHGILQLIHYRLVGLEHQNRRVTPKLGESPHFWNWRWVQRDRLPNQLPTPKQESYSQAGWVSAFLKLALGPKTQAGWVSAFLKLALGPKRSAPKPAPNTKTGELLPSWVSPRRLRHFGILWNSIFLLIKSPFQSMFGNFCPPARCKAMMPPIHGRLDISGWLDGSCCHGHVNPV